MYILPSQDPTRETTMGMLLFSHSVLLINASFPVLDEYLICQPASLLWVPTGINDTKMLSLNSGTSLIDWNNLIFLFIPCSPKMAW